MGSSIHLGSISVCIVDCCDNDMDSSDYHVWFVAKKNCHAPALSTSKAYQLPVARITITIPINITIIITISTTIIIIMSKKIAALLLCQLQRQARCHLKGSA